MNDQITERYERMFAPNPIPQCVKDAYERAAFLMNKVDAPAFNIRDLCILAGTALAGNGELAAPMAAHRTEIDINAPIPIADSLAVGAGPPAQPQGGIMDAPTSNSEKAKAGTYDQLRTMERGELQEHAKLKGLTIPDGLDDAQACEFLMGMPITHRKHVPKTTPPPAEWVEDVKVPKRMGQQRMLKMKSADLRKHALEFYGYKARKEYSKQTIVAVLQQMTPLK